MGVISHEKTKPPVVLAWRSNYNNLFLLS